MRRRRVYAWVLAAAGGLGIGLAWRALRLRPPEEVALAFRVASPVRAGRIFDPGTYWEREGFTEMTAPVRPPTTLDGEAHIVVYLRLPKGATIETRAVDGEAGATLAYPAGTVADRVEYFARAGVDEPPDRSWLAADVRGTSVAPGTQEFHVYRPSSNDANADLLGVAWPRGDEPAQREATRALGALVEEGIVAGPAGGAARKVSAEHLRAINGCAGCHEISRPPRLRLDAPGLVNRGTDASGFFQVSTVLSDRAPLETYRPRNANAGDRFVRFVCGPGDEPARADEGERGAVRCEDGRIPEGILDVRAALGAGDAHARRVCASRRFLYDHLDEIGRRRFADVIRACDGS